jgi:hypothetical protein
MKGVIMANFKFRDLTNERFGRLVVIKESSRGSNRRRRWLCRCDCGTTKVIGSGPLTQTCNPTRSCGCLRVENVVKAVHKHGLYKSPEYAVWEGIVQRCTNPNSTYYADYGGRGISMCPRWRESFADFYADMGTRPTPKHTNERSDNSLGYAPGNCHWATRAAQQKNRRNARLITFNGQTETAHMWSKITGLPSRTITNRLNAGWSPERILTTKPRASGFGLKGRSSVSAV